MFGARRRRKATLEAGFLPEWRDILDRRWRHWALLDAGERARVEDVALGLIARLRWEPANGFALTDEVIVVVAAQAALLVLELPEAWLDGVRTVIVHPTTVHARGEHSQVPGLVSDEPMELLGEAQPERTVFIVWDAARFAARHPERGTNVVFHEFAHVLDMVSGMVDGTPPMDTDEQAQRWVQVCTATYDDVQHGTDSGVLDPYAGVNPGEFFAVATEAFFDVPIDLREGEPDLYAVLADFYGQDPAGRLETRGTRAS